MPCSRRKFRCIKWADSFVQKRHTGEIPLSAGDALSFDKDPRKRRIPDAARAADAQRRFSRIYGTTHRIDMETMTQSEATAKADMFVRKMKDAHLHPDVIDTFCLYYRKVVEGDRGLIYSRDIRPVRGDEIDHLEKLGSFAKIGASARASAVMIVLNGGLGTSMGLAGPKSLLMAREGKSFLEIICHQADRQHLRLTFMNSFNTHEATVKALSAIRLKHPPTWFVQNKFPKILQQGLIPVQWPANPELEWNPPGHGDLYGAIFQSGVLAHLLDMGVRYALVANCDNLGATFDDALLGYMVEKRFPFLMEVARRGPGDFKGGHLAVQRQTGRLLLRESAQCPDDEIAISQDIATYHFFNTNNLWIDLAFLHDFLGRERFVRLPMILNPKTVDPRDESSPKVYQIETAMGSAIVLFEGAAAVEVPRSRFYPVKKCNELLAIRSDCFLYDDDSGFRQNPERAGEPPVIDLDPKFYGLIDRFEERFPFGSPSLMRCRSLKVRGDVLFGRNVELEGDVEIINERGVQILIPDEALVAGTLYL